MDSRQAKAPGYMLYCVLVACIGSFCNGWVIGCANLTADATHACEGGSQHLTSPSLPDCIPMSTSLWGFAVASFCVGGLIGGATGGVIQTRFGRKRTLIYNTAGWIIGALLLGLAVNVPMFVIGRLFCGYSCGLCSLTIPAYIGEISTIKLRGAMGTLNQLFITIGILISSVVGLPTSNVPLWRLNFALVGIPAILQAVLMATCVESPRWLTSQNRFVDAHVALLKLRGRDAIVDNEYYEIVEGQGGTEKAHSMMKDGEKSLDGSQQSTLAPVDHLKSLDTQVSRPDIDHRISNADTVVESPTAISSTSVHQAMNIIDIFRDPLIRRIALRVCALHMIQQLSGMNAVMFYSTSIFKSALDTSMAKYMAIATNALNVIITIPSVLLIDRMGRRPLLMIAEFGACLFSVLLVIGYVYNVSSLLIVSVFLYVASFAIGIGPIPWLITSELTPTYASSAVGAVATAVNWAMNFVIGQVFPVIFAAIAGYSFAIFAGICFMALLFTFFMLPETKNRSMESIVRDFEKHETETNHQTPSIAVNGNSLSPA
ncbi:monosaccharide transporter [Lichtheimia corymbifera JMRC:FSU:9682]|uniref:Monosaccharide transporter n=1 Tax=Lichtheimia corymbifera JMRC:FSU:9682 TaxID=1263082 RepID=A0A068SEX4_9FUNG|nr:monosaccharide transporter [Lichtheimia corymbifera JMRC:FSU:9682]